MPRQIMNISLMSFACLLLFSNIALCSIPPGKFSNFSFSECNAADCYLIKTNIGFISQIKGIFASEKSEISIFSNSKNKGLKQKIYCEELTLDFDFKIATCINTNPSHSFEIDLNTNKISKF